MAYATVFDVTSSERYTTTIDANGIYTGTLTATQVNAVSIDAGSIRTGTLSADRLAAGSINSTKLDAASIKANIINTDYINGLTCTFVRGKIGGWTIGADNITAGSVGAVGAMPIQMRTAASGSGYWYNGAYKPQGIVMTWYQSSNAGHVVFGQIAASGNSVKTGFLGIQMMTWDHVEYFCLSANYTKSGAKEIYNRIAGWAFDNTRIWKTTSRWVPTAPSQRYALETQQRRFRLVRFRPEHLQHGRFGTGSQRQIQMGCRRQHHRPKPRDRNYSRPNGRTRRTGRRRATRIPPRADPPLGSGLPHAPDRL